MSHFCVAVITDGTKGVEEMLAPYQENSMGDVPREYLRFYDAAETERESYEDVDPETGRYGYWENPNAKWDWWVELTIGWVDEYMGGAPIRISDLRFDPQRERERESAWWDENIDGIILAYLHAGGLDRERFLEASSHLWFRAVVTPDGKWHEVGASDETPDALYEWALSFEDRFIRPLDPSCVIHVVDCYV